MYIINENNIYYNEIQRKIYIQIFISEWDAENLESEFHEGYLQIDKIINAYFHFADNCP